ncbi:hypothetical protein BVRB_7g165150 [Beta vulgaris subsp. vulgaris]|nr:hypothetical protein BVRB_7g165150 [Beta vulgaris subsp. vulgaris]
MGCGGSSFGQIFTASAYGMDTLGSFFIIIFGLILFGDLLARMQLL